MLFEVIGKVEKSMQKGVPKVDFLDPFADMGRTGVDLFCFFLSFWCDAKKPCFFDRPKID